MPIKSFNASHVLFLVVEDADLGQSGSVVTITRPQLPILIFTPTVQVEILVNDMSVAVPYRNTNKIEKFVWIYLHLDRFLAFLPSEDLASRSIRSI